MRGRVPARPLTEVAAVAGRVFMEQGYRAAGISDVSKGLGLSHGALYTYVDSKEALLYLVLLAAFEPSALDGLSLPVPAPPEPEIVDMTRRWTERHGRMAALLSAVARRTKPVEVELGGIVDELYGFVEQHWRVLALVESCARDLPELAQLYFVRNRRTYIDVLTTYLDRRIRSGHLRPVPDTATAARFVMETIAWFAWHRRGDPDSAMLTDDASRATVRHLLLSAFLPAAPEE
ncbi:MAG TPA: TetR/AcrR family transcriptional regulator [Pseudonocardiaceae bacterium]|nr:TetR/AcrR family transcriptional regulator [Pseudonocardiaceae bacterium]